MATSILLLLLLRLLLVLLRLLHLRWIWVTHLLHLLNILHWIATRCLRHGIEKGLRWHTLPGGSIGRLLRITCRHWLATLLCCLLLVLLHHSELSHLALLGATILGLARAWRSLLLTGLLLLLLLQ